MRRDETDQVLAASRLTGRGGRVSFVGAGPGHPDLLTLAAVRAIAQADAILVDDDALRELISAPQEAHRPDALVVSLADLPDPQDRARTVAGAMGDGRSVVRLVAGDPFLDGGIAGEAAACGGLGLRFEVVPGVSALTAVPEYAGIALDDASGIHFVSAICEPLSPERARAAIVADTIVLSTRAGDVADCARVLVDAGRAASDSCVITWHGGSRQQRTESSMLSRLTQVVARHNPNPDEHVHIMIGHATQPDRRANLDWYETKPLFGWDVLVPRTKDDLSAVVQRLDSYGSHCCPVPTISVEPPRNPQQLERAIRGLVEGRHAWVVFTSSNAVRAVREKLAELGLDARALSGLKVAAVCGTTAAALRAWGIEPDLVPAGDHTTQGLAAAFPERDLDLDPVNGVFVPRAELATEALAAALTELGWQVEEATAYRTVRAAPPPAEIREAIKRGRFDAVVFTSSATVRNLVGIAGKPHSRSIIAAIGPATAAACEENGLRVDVIAASPAPLELADALARFAAERRSRLLGAGATVTKPSQRTHGSRRRS